MKFSERMVNCHRIPDVDPQWQADKIELYFKDRQLPDTLQFDHVTKINNVRNFIDGHIAFLRQHSTKPIYRPYYNRLIKLTKLI